MLRQGPPRGQGLLTLTKFKLYGTPFKALTLGVRLLSSLAPLLPPRSSSMPDCALPPLVCEHTSPAEGPLLSGTRHGPSWPRPTVVSFRSSPCTAGTEWDLPSW